LDNVYFADKGLQKNLRCFIFLKSLVIFSIKILSQNQLDLEMSVYWRSLLVWILAVQSISAGFNNIAKSPVEKINP